MLEFPRGVSVAGEDRSAVAVRAVAADFKRRKVRRLRDAIELWRAQRGQGFYPRARIRQELRTLHVDLAALLGRVDP